MKHPSGSTLPLAARPTRHFQERASHRRLRDSVRDFVIRYGVDIRAAGATHLVVMERQLPADLRRSSTARRARDWILVLADDGALLTCYRRRRAVRFVRRKTGCTSRSRCLGGGAASLAMPRHTEWLCP